MQLLRGVGTSSFIPSCRLRAAQKSRSTYRVSNPDPTPVVAAVIVAAGRGQRAGGIAGSAAKQYRDLGRQPVLAWSLGAFMKHNAVRHIVTVIHPDDEELFGELMGPLPDRHRLVFGASTRQGSVKNGLEALAECAPDIVLIHDAARPFLTSDVIDRAIEAAERHGAAVPGVRIADTIAEVDQGDYRKGTLPRERLRSIQTPQSFRFEPILQAHRKAEADERYDFTDDGAIATWAGLPVMMFDGDAGNVKLTTADDLVAAARRVESGQAYETRTGTGFDVHALGPGDHVVVNGLKVPHGQGLIGHSDADVGLHALTDALLGALADGDIGKHFPPSDMKWKGADSSLFLADAGRRVTERGGFIVHCDVTIVCEAPKIGPHRDAMRERIAAILDVAVDRVSVKATTTERLGFAGRQEGIAAMAAATIRLPAESLA